MFAHQLELWRRWIRREVRCVLAELGLIPETHVDNPPIIYTPEPTPAPVATAIDVQFEEIKNQQRDGGLK